MYQPAILSAGQCINPLIVGTGGGFGQPTQQSGGLFGSAATTQSGGLFSAQPTTSFGATGRQFKYMYIISQFGLQNLTIEDIVTLNALNFKILCTV